MDAFFQICLLYWHLLKVFPPETSCLSDKCSQTDNCFNLMGQESWSRSSLSPILYNSICIKDSFFFFLDQFPRLAKNSAPRSGPRPLTARHNHIHSRLNQRVWNGGVKGGSTHLNRNTCVSMMSALCWKNTCNKKVQVCDLCACSL